MSDAAANVIGALARYRAAIEPALRAALGEADDPLSAAGRYVMGWEDEQGRPADFGGKRIRPALCLLAAELFGGTVEDGLPGAVAVELVHNFSLVHDEVQDHDTERHHRATIWALMGEAQAINVGDFLYSRAFRALATGPGEPGRRLAALNVLNDAIEEMIAGQWQDVAFERRLDVRVEDYLTMVAGKTGALLGAPLEIGALLAGASNGEARVIGHWGRQVGLAFQAQDDYLGTWGNPDQTGKSNSNDIGRRKKTLPVVYGLASPAAADAIRAAYARDGELTEADTRGVVNALESVHADAACRAFARDFAARADELLGSLSLSVDQRDALRAIAAYLVERAG